MRPFLLPVPVLLALVLPIVLSSCIPPVGDPDDGYPGGCRTDNDTVVVDVGKVYSTIVATDCLEDEIYDEFDSATADDIYVRGGSSHWGDLDWYPDEGDEGERVGTVTHCSFGTSIAILKMYLLSDDEDCVEDYAYLLIGTDGVESTDGACVPAADCD